MAVPAYGPSLCVEPKNIIATDPSPNAADDGTELGSTPYLPNVFWSTET